MTEDVNQWDAALQHQTQVVWGEHIGDTLRRLLPLVESVTVRGYGPEAPPVGLTPLRDDGWLSLELHPGLYTRPSVPAPTITLLENSGLHDGGFWPSDGDCISDKGCLCTTEGCVSNRSLAVAEQRQFVGAHGSGMWSTDGVPLSCYWRATIELLRDSGRPVFATSYQSHEHMVAVENVQSVGARIEHAFPNGFREVSTKVVELDLLDPPGVLAEAMRDPHPRSWGDKEASYAATAAMWWRYRIDVQGYERHVRLARNSHILSFRGRAQPTAQTASEIQRRLQKQACEAAELPSIPKRQAAIVRDVWRCANPFP